VANAVHNNTQRGTRKRSRRGSSFFLTRPSPFLIFYRTLHLETYALTRFFSSKSASWCVFSLSLILLFYCYHCAWCEDIERERETNGETWNRRERNGRSDLEESFIFLVIKRFCCKISSLENQIIIALWKETNDDGFHVGQR